MPKTALPDIPSYNYWELDGDKKIHAVKFKVRPNDEARGLSVHRIDHYAIRWVVKGQGQILINNIPMELKPNFNLYGQPFPDHSIFNRRRSGGRGIYNCLHPGINWFDGYFISEMIV